eukprot:TRINITY_DN32385_c0_g1_i1.p1 TRINITY_DN32385_c0_g1~~TRINITY_DN32385_c0_g1_i1.p1  ORF type:complete len:565 (-),score=150.73 TRINITY_DN32385_c0_g1_i1:83-1777(-)
MASASGAAVCAAANVSSGGASGDAVDASATVAACGNTDMALDDNAAAATKPPSGAVIAVVEKPYDTRNRASLYRTCCVLGLRELWEIAPAAPLECQPGAQPSPPLLLRTFASTASCLEALRREGYEIWATDLSTESVELLPPSKDEPGVDTLAEGCGKRLAVVFGQEHSGMSNEMLAAAHRRVYFPLQGFTESLNVGVAAALVLHRVLQLRLARSEGAFHSLDAAVTRDAVVDAAAEAAPRRLRYAEAVLQRRTSRLIVVLEPTLDARDHSAVLRTCECLGVQHVWLVQEAEVRRGKGTVKQRARRQRREAELAAMRAAMGGAGAEKDAEVSPSDPTGDAAAETLPTSKVSRQATEWLTVRTFASSADCAEALKEETDIDVWGISTAPGDASSSAAEADAALDLRWSDCGSVARSAGGAAADAGSQTPQCRRRLAVVFGHEHRGLSAEMRAIASRLVRGHALSGSGTEMLSYTVSCALTIQSILDSNQALCGDMLDEERQTLRRQWFLRLAKTAEQREEYPARAAAASPPAPLRELRRDEALRADGHRFINPKIVSRTAAVIQE